MNIDEGRKFAVITGGSSGIGYEFAKCALSRTSRSS
jgi:short-subunit dehydrogenase